MNQFPFNFVIQELNRGEKNFKDKKKKTLLQSIVKCERECNAHGYNVFASPLSFLTIVDSCYATS
jgi:hypothetical protein